MMDEVVNSNGGAASNSGEHPPIQKHILAAYMVDMFTSHIIFYDWLWKQENPLGNDVMEAHEAGELVLSVPAPPYLKETLIRGICYPGSIGEKEQKELIELFLEAASNYLNTAPEPSHGQSLSFNDVEEWLMEHEGRMALVIQPYTGYGRVLLPAHLHHERSGNSGVFRSTREYLGAEEMKDTCHGILYFLREVVDLAKGEKVKIKKIPENLSEYMERREFTEEELELLLPLADLTVAMEDEDAHEVLRPMAMNISSLTWGKIFSFAALVQEYNLEWALAAMEWGEEEAVVGEGRSDD